jgi:hypothetical protein
MRSWEFHKGVRQNKNCIKEELTSFFQEIDSLINLNEINKAQEMIDELPINIYDYACSLASQNNTKIAKTWHRLEKILNLNFGDYTDREITPDN